VCVCYCGDCRAWEQNALRPSFLILLDLSQTGAIGLCSDWRELRPPFGSSSGPNFSKNLVRICTPITNCSGRTPPVHLAGSATFGVFHILCVVLLMYRVHYCNSFAVNFMARLIFGLLDYFLTHSRLTAQSIGGVRKR